MTQDNKDLLENRIPLGLLEPDIFEKTYEAVGSKKSMTSRMSMKR